MSVEVKESPRGNVIAVAVTGRLDGRDYDAFVPLVEAAIKEHGKIRFLLEMHDFHGWDGSALWADIKFDWKHFGDIEKIAMIGDSKWEHGMAILCRPFTRAKVRYFPESERERALSWIVEA